MGVGWVEIFWTIFHRPLKNPAITLDDATFFGETIPKKKWQSFSRSKNWNCLPYMLFHIGKAGKPNCFSNIWDLLKKNSQFQVGFPVPVTLFSGKFLRHFKNAVPHGWQAVAAWSSDWWLDRGVILSKSLKYIWDLSPSMNEWKSVLGQPGNQDQDQIPETIRWQKGWQAAGLEKKHHWSRILIIHLNPYQPIINQGIRQPLLRLPSGKHTKSYFFNGP